MPTLWTVQILTPDYLVEGIYNKDADPYNGIELFRAPGDGDAILNRLSSARRQSTGLLAVPAGTCKDWFFCTQSEMLAVIPRDEASTAYAVKNSKFKSVLPADIYVGSYLMRGVILNPDSAEHGLDAVTDSANFAVQNARIECKLPGVRWPGLDVPFMLVRTSRVQGIATR
jgi:hypothetical protein